MQFASALSTHAELRTAVNQTAAEIRAGVPRVDVAFVFVSPAYGRDLPRLPALLEEALPETSWRVGCTGGGVVGGGREAESQRALAVLGAHLPGVDLHGGHISAPDLPGPDAPPADWARAIGVPRSADVRAILVLTDPFGLPCQDLLVGLDYAWAGVPKVGGVASGSRNPEDVRLFAGRQSFATGAVVLGLAGDVRVEPFVAQGCRPIGNPVPVVQARDSQLLRVGEGTAVDYLHETLQGLPQGDRTRAQQGNLFLGLAQDPLGAEVPGPGEFLIRQLIGIAPEQGGLTVAGRPALGSTVQFHLRDSDASAADLRQVLSPLANMPPPQGALMFTCLGRGEHLYGTPDHDSKIVREVCGPVPMGGFFCNGEIGPVGGRSYLHGFTASFAMFRPR